MPVNVLLLLHTKLSERETKYEENDRRRLAEGNKCVNFEAKIILKTNLCSKVICPIYFGYTIPQSGNY